VQGADTREALLAAQSALNNPLNMALRERAFREINLALRSSTVGGANAPPASLGANMSSIDETRRFLNTLAEVLDDAFNEGKKPKRTAFVLLVMPFDAPEGQRTNYVSNAKREDIVNMMKEVVARFEGQPEMSGKA
jgi:hypothetical protein